MCPCFLMQETSIDKCLGTCTGYADLYSRVRIPPDRLSFTVLLNMSYKVGMRYAHDYAGQ